MKITGGEFKGRAIVCPAGTRPVSTKVRQACFDILGQEIEGKRVLDLCAGSGALGLESLSRGAVSAVFVDNRWPSVTTIRQNITICGKDLQAQPLVKDAIQAIHDFYKKNVCYDIIFADPPYYKGLMRKILQALTEYDILAPHGYIICFCYNKDPLSPCEKTSEGEIFCHTGKEKRKEAAVDLETINKTSGGSISFDTLFSCLVDKNYGQTRLAIYNKI